MVANVLDLVGPCLRRGIKLIEPLYKQRLHEMEKAGNDWTGKDVRSQQLYMNHLSLAHLYAGRHVVTAGRTQQPRAKKR